MLSPKLKLKQIGATLILVAFVLALIATAFLLKAYDLDKLRSEQDIRTMQTLNKAKQALIAWSVSHSNHPGQMPFPDRNADGNYDGNSDCNSPVSTFDYKFLIGQLPLLKQTNPCISPQTSIGENFKDSQGNKLWYAVSRNLTHIYENNPITTLHDPVINPDIILYPYNNPNYINYPSIQTEVRSYPWLKVLDRNGIVVSDHVAVVIIAPGNALGSQDRSSVTSNATEFLDSFVIGSVGYSNSNYATPDQAFVMGQDSRTVKDTDLQFVKPYFFNDKLVYITIEELMSALNKRAAGEAGRLLNKYKNKTGQFPYASKLDSRQVNHVSSSTSQKGLIPIDGTDQCTCESQFKCSCSFNPIIKLNFTRGSGTWAARTGACTRNLASCNCTSAGSCTNGSEFFTCDSAGVCEHNVTGSNSFTYTVPDYADIKVLSGGCYILGKKAICNDVAQLQIGLDVPAWFKENLWQDFLYYEWSNINSLKIGSRSSINTLLIATGPSIINELGHTQARPSLLISDYLDSSENNNNDHQFDGFTKAKSTLYNDQPFIVAP